MKVESQSDAIQGQRALYNEKVRQSGQAAYGAGVFRDIQFRQRINFALRLLVHNARVLDIGCGDGTITKAIATRAQQVICLDVSEAAIALAREKNPASNVTYLCGSVEEYDLDGQFDLVTMFEVLEHVFDPDVVLERIGALLKDGGTLTLSTPNRTRLDAYLLKWYCRLKGRPWQYTEDEDHVREYAYLDVIALLKRHNFKIRKVEALNLSMWIGNKFPWTEGWQTLMANTGRLAPRWAHHVYYAATKCP